MEDQILGFIDFFKQVPDHRIERRKLHSVEEILLVAFCGVIAGCEGWDDLELFGKTKIAFLKKYLSFQCGAPSDDTLRRFFRALDPQKFEACFVQWVRSFQIDLENKVVAIDGKTSRHSFDGNTSALHVISAFASEIGIVLGQLKVDGKSNEITAIPHLLDICFGDDQSRIRKGNAPQNMAVIKKTVINLLQIIKKERPRISLKRMRKLAGWDHDFLNTVLMAKF